MSRRILDAVFSGALFALSIWFWLIANAFPTSPRYALIDTDFWPKIIFGLMALITGLITVQNVRTLLRERAAAGSDAPGPDWAAIGRMAAMGLLVVAYFVAFGRIGFLLSTLAFLWIAAFMLPSGPRWLKIVFSPVFTVLLTVVFAYVLGLPLPRGTGVFYDLSLMLY
ncbi:tripartite tricarboxylate transporter TctB family protein [Roseivivax isoporae]|uniref:DUF1468 domain-containing protein n=1 Tax=Roseivivax isoporae LMG 25204 TaxID=1449351 RepID=X7FA93_9RHOB|nr:tripartite tricarboxylate transporter TctB family protein [Roseivivax isoporae]ETX28994.1 hypothetical protein RISW2_03370 [Roseivivax isoporae LMG 25204]